VTGFVQMGHILIRIPENTCLKLQKTSYMFVTKMSINISKGEHGYISNQNLGTVFLNYH